MGPQVSRRLFAKQLPQLPTHIHFIGKTEARSGHAVTPNGPTAVWAPWASVPPFLPKASFHSSLVRWPPATLASWMILGNTRSSSQLHTFVLAIPFAWNLLPWKADSFTSFRSQLKCHPYHWCYIEVSSVPNHHTYLRLRATWPRIPLLNVSVSGSTKEKSLSKIQKAEGIVPGRL